METEVVTADFPAGFDELRAQALREGFRQIERLATVWEAHRTRFDRAGEALLTVRVDGTLGGIGGLTVEPVVPNALRMRRFYVRPAFRRGGVGRRLVMALLAHVRPGQLITANAAPTSVAFWESIGFEPDQRDRHAHILDQGRA
jgi:GNAT superfamily N-acetyltransferase